MSKKDTKWKALVLEFILVIVICSEKKNTRLIPTTIEVLCHKMRTKHTHKLSEQF